MIASAVFNIAIFLGLWLGLWLPGAVPLALWLKWRPFQASDPAQKLPLLLWLYLVAPVALGIFRQLNPQPLSAYGLRFQPDLLVSLATGLLVGSGSLALLFWGQICWGWLQRSEAATQASAKTVAAIAAIRALLPLLGLALLVGGIEELVFRGLMQTQLQTPLQVGGWWPAAAVISLLFAALHGLWEGKSVLRQLPGLWLMGMVLTLARQVDAGGLGLAWGLHAGWVWALASLDALGFSSTGKAAIWLTGDRQPLAGLLGLLFLLGTGAGLWVCWTLGLG